VESGSSLRARNHKVVNIKPDIQISGILAKDYEWRACNKLLEARMLLLSSDLRVQKIGISIFFQMFT
jgi:hypothetical protein